MNRDDECSGTVRFESNVADVITEVKYLLPKLQKIVDGTYGTPDSNGTIVTPTKEQLDGFSESMQYIKEQLPEMKRKIEQYSAGKC